MSTSTPDRHPANFPLPTNQEFLAHLEKESDRGAILILGAYIEEALGIVITRHCVSDAAASKLLKHGQAGGTFEARLTLAEAFGFLHDSEIVGLRILQKIRNKAAHFDRSGRGFDVLFDSALTADQVVALADLFGYRKPERQAAALRLALVDIVEKLVLSFFIRNTRTQAPAPAQSIEELAMAQFDAYKHQLTPDAVATFKAELPDKLPQHTALYMAGLALQLIADGYSAEEVERMLQGEKVSKPA
ncbi:MAG: hypothetical protein ACRYG7_07745 [Janthinobacterium lividum]